jgi:dGTPase
MIEDVIAESLRRLKEVRPASSDDVRHAGRTLLGFSRPMEEADRAIKAMLGRQVYRHVRVREVMDKAEGIVRRLFGRYRDDPAALPPDWRPAPEAEGDRVARRIADSLAGMTDRYAIGEYRRLFDEDPALG